MHANIGKKPATSLHARARTRGKMRGEPSSCARMKARQAGVTARQAARVAESSSRKTERRNRVWFRPSSAATRSRSRSGVSAPILTIAETLVNLKL